MKWAALVVFVLTGAVIPIVSGQDLKATRAAHAKALRAIERGDWGAAEKSAAKARGFYRASGAADPGLLAAIENRLGLAQLELELLADAERSFRTALEILNHGPDTEGVKSKVMANLGRCLVRIGKPDEGLPLLVEAYGAVPADSPLRWETLFDALDAAQTANRVEAIPELLGLLRTEISARTGESDRADRLFGRLHLIDAALSRNDANLAANELDAAVRDAGRDAAHPMQAAFALTTARIRLMRGDAGGALAHIQGFVHATGKKYGERSTEYTLAVERYAAFLENAGKPEMAEPMLLLAASLAVDRLTGHSVREFRKAIERLEEFYGLNKEPRLRRSIGLLHDVTGPKIVVPSDQIEAMSGSLLELDGSGRILLEVQRLFEAKNVQNDEARRMLASLGLGTLLLERRLIHEARVCFKRIVRYAETHGAPRYAVFARNNLLATHIVEGQLSDAEKIALDAVAQIERFDGKLSPLLESFLHNLIGIEQRRQNLFAALKWADRLVAVTKTGYQQNLTKNLIARFLRADIAAAAGTPGGLEDLQVICAELRTVVEKVEKAEDLAAIKDQVIYASMTLPILGEPAAAIALIEVFGEKLEQLAPPDKNPGLAEFLLTLHSIPAIQLRQLGAIDRAAELIGTAFRAQVATPLSSSESLKNFWKLAVDLSIEQLVEQGVDGQNRDTLLKEASKWHEEQLRRFHLEAIPVTQTPLNQVQRAEEEAELTINGARLAFVRGDIVAAEEGLAKVAITEKNRVQRALLEGQVAMARGDHSKAAAVLRAAKLDQSSETLRREFSWRLMPRDYFRAALVLCYGLQREGGTSELRETVQRTKSVYKEHFTELRTQWPPEIILSANMFRDLAGVVAATDDPNLIAETLAHHKGEAGDGARMSRSPKVKELRLEMGKLLQRLPADTAHWTAEHNAIELKITSLERAIERALTARDSTATRSVDFERAQASLRSGQLLADFVEFSAIASNGNIESRYGVLIVRHDAPPVWHVLKEDNIPVSARSLDTLIGEVRAMIEAPPKGDSEDRILAALARLETIIWEPIAAVINATRITEVLVAPDGALSEVPFAALRRGEPGSRRFLSEEPYVVRFIGSMRDLLSPFHRPDRGQILVIAAPTLADGSVAKSPSYQQEEARMVDALGSALGFTVPNPLIGDAATEETAQARLQENQASILHFAVHGYSRHPGRNAFQDFAGYGGIRLRPSSSGNQNIFRDGDSLTAEDGFFAWREMASLKLDRAWLAVLSSCGTGLGVRRAGEGVLGIRWGFRQAGVPAQLVTLWDIDDSPETVALMKAFYEELASSERDARTVAWRLQQRFLAEAARRSAQDAIRIYGSFVLYATGP
jgi:CHAT domain-containing protein